MFCNHITNYRKRPSSLPGVFAQSEKPGVLIIVEPVFLGKYIFGRLFVDYIESLIKHTALHILENNAYVNNLFYSFSLRHFLCIFIKGGNNSGANCIYTHRTCTYTNAQLHALPCELVVSSLCTQTASRAQPREIAASPSAMEQYILYY